ncbi:hypothetical protein F4808DRAFT_472904 [Astrocystis sublimbata]|nr:hypothetical protein F4808DRAFT_472904 [Astrocystis sublimbata]
MAEQQLSESIPPASLVPEFTLIDGVTASSEFARMCTRTLSNKNCKLRCKEWSKFYDITNGRTEYLAALLSAAKEGKRKWGPLARYIQSEVLPRIGTNRTFLRVEWEDVDIMYGTTSHFFLRHPVPVYRLENKDNHHNQENFWRMVHIDYRLLHYPLDHRYKNRPYFIAGAFIAMEQRFHLMEWEGQRTYPENPPTWQILFTDGLVQTQGIHLYTAQVPDVVNRNFESPDEPFPKPLSCKPGEENFQFRINHITIPYEPSESFRQRLSQSIQHEKDNYGKESTPCDPHHELIDERQTGHRATVAI